MSQLFEFVSHEEFPEDKYVKEIVYLLVNGLRIGYVHKLMQNGGSFWDVMGCSVTRGGEKETHKAVKFGDAFLADDIKEYLKRRRFEDRALHGSVFSPQPQRIVASQPRTMSEVAENDDVPF